MLKSWGWGGGVVAHKILVTSPEAKFLFPFLGFGLGLGLGLVNNIRSFSCFVSRQDLLNHVQMDAMQGR